jgi:hypothetical protein
MTITVGTDTYVTVEDAIEYLALMGLPELPVDEGAAPNASAELALKRATRAIDNLYGGRFIGVKADYEQPLQWPRVHDVDEVVGDTPIELSNATTEMYALMIDSDVYVQPEPQLIKETVQLDVIQESREFAETYAPNLLHKIAMILRPLISSSGSGMARIARG